MFILIDKNTGKVISNYGTNSAFPDGNIPNIELKENEEAIRIHDNSDLVQDILDAQEYELELQGTDCIHVNVIKSKSEYMHEQKETPEYKRKEIEAQLKELDTKFLDARLIEDLIKKNPIHQSKLDIIIQKDSLRQQLQELEG